MAEITLVMTIKYITDFENFIEKKYIHKKWFSTATLNFLFDFQYLKLCDGTAEQEGEDMHDGSPK